MEQPTQALRNLEYALKSIQDLEVPPVKPDLFGSLEELHNQEREVARDTVDLVEAKHELCSDLSRVVDHGGLVDIISVVREVRRLNKEAEYLIIHLSLNERMGEFKQAAESAKAAFNEFLDYMGGADINIEFIIPKDPPCRHGTDPCDCVIN